MSYYTLVIFAALFCLSQCMPMDPVIPPVPEFYVPSYQDHIEGFMKEMNSAAEKHLQPLMADLDQADQQQVVEYGIISFINYIDYVLHIINASQDAKILRQLENKSDDDDKDDYDNYENDNLGIGSVTTQAWIK